MAVKQSCDWFSHSQWLLAVQMLPDTQRIQCFNYILSRLVQEVLAPSVLSNHGCSGDESRLVGCPVAASTRGSAARGTVNTQPGQ